MKSCEQTPGQTVWEHGVSVHEQFLILYRELITGSGLKIIQEHKDQLIQGIQKHDPDEIKTYHIYHDCGKPYVIEFDEEGRRHFPKHAESSYCNFKRVSDNEKIGLWILHDMDMHLMTKEQVPAFKKIQGWEVLLLTGLAELNANAEMFGGKDSVSYKIKLKKYIQRCKWILQEEGV
jgi:hypothetical protein